MNYTELKFHPIAEIFPLMEGEEFTALVADIKANGLQERIKLYRGHVIDGRNRVRALIELGQRDFSGLCWKLEDEDGFDPVAFVISANIRRRHLTAEQNRELVAKLIKAQPEKPDLQIAKMVGKSPTTVGAVRAKMEASGDVSKVETRTDSRGREQPARKARRGNPLFKKESTRGITSAAPKKSTVVIDGKAAIVRLKSELAATKQQLAIEQKALANIGEVLAVYDDVTSLTDLGKAVAKIRKIMGKREATTRGRSQ
jgi:DNA-binding Lrp family transcriptional regulator